MQTQNIGTIWRSAQIMRVDFIFIIGGNYKRMKTDTIAAHRHIPLFYFENFPDFYKSLPFESKLIGIELDEKSIPISEFKHAKQAVYLLGSEKTGLSEKQKTNVIFWYNYLANFRCTFLLLVQLLFMTD